MGLGCINIMSFILIYNYGTMVITAGQLQYYAVYVGWVGQRRVLRPFGVCLTVNRNKILTVGPGQVLPCEELLSSTGSLFAGVNFWYPF